MDGYVMRYLVNYGTKSVPLWRAVQHLLKDDEVPVMALIKESEED
jgi:hypothetical protein